MVAGVVRGRYDLPLTHEGVLALEAVGYALITPDQPGALKTRINSTSCPVIGQVSRVSRSFEHVLTEDRHICKTCATSGASDINGAQWHDFVGRHQFHPDVHRPSDD